MSDAYVGEIILFAGNYVPQNYVLCDGSSLSIRQYTSLYAVIGTYYGGDGVNTFNVPDLRSRVPLGQGQGPGLTPYQVGQQAGAENITLTQNQMPTHTHFANCSAAPGTQASPAGAVWAEGPGSIRTPSPNQYATVSGATMGNAIQPAGGSAPHANVQPVLAITFLICVNGIFPPRS